MTVAVLDPLLAGTGTTLARYVELLGEELGTYAEYVVSTTATTGEARRLVLIDELRDDEEARDRWGGGYLYAKSGLQAGNQRRILRDGYEGPLGALVLSRPLAAALAAGSSVALSKPLPVREYIGVKGLTEIVLEALAPIDVEARITFTGDGTRSRSLEDYPFIRSADDVIGLKDRYGLTLTEPTDWSPYPFTINTNGPVVTLEPGYAYTSAETFELIVPVPADTLISDDGGLTWGYTTSPGLVADTDQAAAKPHHVVAFGMVKALRYLMRMVMADPTLSAADKQLQRADLVDLLRMWNGTANRIIRTEMPDRRLRSVRSIVGGVGLTTVQCWT